MSFHDLIGFLAACLAVYAFVPYFAGIASGTAKPHVFTWLLFAVLSGIGGAAQLAAGGGAGAWVILTSSFMCLLVFLFALKWGERHITRSDWISFTAALMALLVWYISKDPLWSVILVIFIDMMAFYPTFRKSWHRPWDEVLQSYALSAVKFSLGLVALEQVNLATVLYPVYLVAANVLFIIMVLRRRKTLR